MFYCHLSPARSFQPHGSGWFVNASQAHGELLIRWRDSIAHIAEAPDLSFLGAKRHAEIIRVSFEVLDDVSCTDKVAAGIDVKYGSCSQERFRFRILSNDWETKVFDESKRSRLRPD